MNKTKNLLATLVMLAVTAAAHAQTTPAALPSPEDITAKIVAIGGVAGAAGLLGLAIWSYVKTKRKGGQALA
jgi:hypothetical protein